MSWIQTYDHGGRKSFCSNLILVFEATLSVVLLQKINGTEFLFNSVNK